MAKNIFLLLLLITANNLIAQNSQKRTGYHNLEIWWSYSVEGIPGSYQYNSVNVLPLWMMDKISADQLFDGGKIDSLRKFENKNWTFEYFLKKDEINEIFENYTLCTDRLEVYSEIYLNNKFITENRNNFTRNYYNITHIFKSGRKNNLKIKIHSPVKRALEIYGRDEIKYPSDSEESEIKTSQFTRQPAYEYGWDFSPRLLLLRLAKQICIIGWDDFIIYHQYIKQDSITESKAYLTAFFEIETSKQIDLNIRYGYISPAIDVTKSLSKGKHLVSLPIVIDDPKLWWPKGLYEQLNAKEDYMPVIYEIGFSFSTNKQYEYKEIETGIKTIELIREKDKWGESFYFKVNGRKIFAKGANIVPKINPYYLSSDRHYDLILDERDYLQNMNMIRIWGGGEYLDDEFYTQCDIYGIMVWQDFMFANTMYPSDSAFLNNVKEEAEFQVKRLSRHPCIALWCGNNEIEVAWKNWGWQEKYKYTPEQIKELEDGYNNIFNEILPEAVKKYGNGVSYLSSSPVSNWGKPEDFTKGDNHYWGVWHGEYPIDSFKTQIPRFVSEYGFPSFPNIETIKKYFFTDKSNRTDTIDLNRYNINSPEFTYRMRSYKGLQLLWKYVNDYYGEPKDFESFLILTQMMQAEAYKMAIEAHRRAKPYCMGTMYWQLNDAWPGVSWSTIDYDGKNKIAHDVVVDAYQEMIISPVEENEKINVYVVSDYIHKKYVRINLRVYDFSGNLFSDTTFISDIASDTSQVVFSVTTDRLIRKDDRNKKMIITELEIADEKGKYQSHDLNYLLLKNPKELQFVNLEELIKDPVKSLHLMYIWEIYPGFSYYSRLLKKYNP